MQSLLCWFFNLISQILINFSYIFVNLALKHSIFITQLIIFLNLRIPHALHSPLNLHQLQVFLLQFANQQQIIIDSIHKLNNIGRWSRLFLFD